MNLGKILGISAGVIVLGLVGFYAIDKFSEYSRIKERKEIVEEVLKSHKEQRTIRIMPNETYWNYAQTIRKNLCLKGVKNAELVEYLQEINDGKNLMAGRDFNYPIYDSQTCKKLSDFGPKENK